MKNQEIDRIWHWRTTLFVGILLAFVLLLGVSFGPISLDFMKILRTLFGLSGGLQDEEKILFLQLRLPRVLLAALVGAALDVPREEHARQRRDAGQQHERHADAVGGEVVADAEFGDPREVDDGLQAGGRNEGGSGEQREREGGDGRDESDPAGEGVGTCARREREEGAGK